MEKTIVKAEYIKQVQGDDELIGKLAKASRKSYWTILRWLNENHEYLTMATTLNVISKHLKVPVKSLTEVILIEEEIT